MKKWDPDIIASVRFLTTNEGGRKQGVKVQDQPDYYACCFVFSDSYFDCRLFGCTVHLGVNTTVSIKFLSPDSILPRLKVGDHFELWEGKIVAQGRIIEIPSIPEHSS